MAKRNIENYNPDLIALVDITKAIDRARLNTDSRIRVLNYIIGKYIGDDYCITRKP